MDINFTDTFEATVHGVLGAPKVPCKYAVEGNRVAFHIPYFSFYSNSDELKLSDLPSSINPAIRTRHGGLLAQNNGQYFAVVSEIDPAHPGGIVFSLDGDPRGWSPVGTKGVGFTDPASPNVFSGMTIWYEVVSK